MTMYAETTDNSPARVALASDRVPRGRFDGAWWPRSRDFVTEIPPLLTALEGLGHFTRATVDLVLWPGVPRPFEITGLGRAMRWGGFAVGQDPHRIVLYSVGGVKELLVIPPQTDPRVAAQLMITACAANQTRSATQLLDDSEG